MTLKAEPDGGTFDLQVHARKYTKEQADAMEEELAPKLRALILGDNPDLFHVRKNLNLVRKAEGYPFRISWSATSYTYLDTDGTVHAEEIPRDESSSLVLTAALSLDGNRWEEKFPVVLLPEELTAEEAFQRSVQEAAKEAEEESAEETALVLPDTVEGTALSWQQVLEDESLKVFLLMVAAAGLIFGAGHRDLAAKVKKREQELSLDYPQLVTKLVLFLGTGMAVRNAFRRISDDYLAGRKKEEKRDMSTKKSLSCVTNSRAVFRRAPRMESSGADAACAPTPGSARCWYRTSERAMRNSSQGSRRKQMQQWNFERTRRGNWERKLVRNSLYR